MGKYFSIFILTKKNSQKKMIDLIYNIGNIAGGILLGIAMLDKWDGESNFFNKIANYLAPFQTIIGGGILVLGTLFLIGNGKKLFNIVSILGGLLLLTHALTKIPAIGDSLKMISDKLAPFKAIIGIALMIVGVLGLL